MTNKLFIALLLYSFLSFNAFSQNDTVQTKKTEIPKELVVTDTIISKEPIDPLRPSKAAFYSAVLPGLGQAYNKKYWKIPIVYGALATSLYFYVDNDKEYKRYRNAYKRRLAGFTDDEFFGSVTDDGLRRAQKTLRRNKEISLLVTIGIYALNIIDANVDAHLLQYNIDENLSLNPNYQLNEIDGRHNYGLSLNFKF